MASRFRRRRPAAESSGTKTPFSATGFARELHQPRRGAARLIARRIRPVLRLEQQKDPFDTAPYR
jgi:hypothetical protein